jgi:CheY-like chemotaxis protein
VNSRILVVEDEPENRLLIRMVLSMEGYEVAEVEDAIHLDTVVARERPDLILLDVMMPGINGYEALEALRASEATRTLPVVMLTALAQRSDVERAIAGGVDGYLTKPFEPAELVGTVQSALQRARKGKQD